MIHSIKQYGSICLLIVLLPVAHAAVTYSETGICKGCEFINRSCKRQHPTDCSKFIQCMEQDGKVVAVEFFCSWGLHWDDRTGTCDFPDKANCKNDPCREIGAPPYPYGANCRSYWECVDLHAKPKCCAPGNSFSKTNGCTLDPTCDVNIPCEGVYKTAPISTTTPSTECPYRVADPAGNTFIGRGTLVVRSCGTGQIFNETFCACIQVSNETSACSPRFDLQFNGTELVDLTTRSTSYNMNGVDGAGVFLGGSSVVLWEFDGSPLEDLIDLRLKFKPFPGGPPQQVLASNCKTMGSDEPSIAIEIDRLAGLVYFKGVTDTVMANISVPFTYMHWNEVRWSFKNATLTGTNTFDGVPSDNSAALQGVLKMSTNPFKIGACDHFVDGYYGQISRVTYYGCEPDPAQSTGGGGGQPPGEPNYRFASCL